VRCLPLVRYCRIRTLYLRGSSDNLMPGPCGSVQRDPGRLSALTSKAKMTNTRTKLFEGQGAWILSLVMFLIVTCLSSHPVIASDDEDRTDDHTLTLTVNTALKERRYDDAITLLEQTLARPEGTYPPKMLQLFRDVRTETQGSYRVVGLTRPDALVTLEADTLIAARGDSLLCAINLPAGSYRVTVHTEYTDTAHDTATTMDFSAKNIGRYSDYY